jgi:outer membrane protein TolC
MKPFTFAILMSLLSRGLAAAQAPETVTLTLDDAVRRGLATSQRLVEASAREEVAGAVADQRRAAGLPQVGFQAGYSRTNHVQEFGVLMPNNELRLIYPDIPDNLQTRVDLRWPIYTAGRVAAAERAARADTAAAAKDRETLQADVRLEVTRAYWALVTAIESERVVAQSLTRIEAHLADVRSRLEAGLVAPNEVLTTQAQESRQRMLHIQAAANREVVEADLARLIGELPGRRLQPTAELLPPVAGTAVIADLVGAASRRRPERAALLQRVQAADARAAAAAAGAKPTIGVGGGVDYARPNPRIFPRQAEWADSWDASISVNWPLFDGGRVRAERAEAAASLRAVRARLDDFDSALEVELRQRLSELRASLAAIGAADDGVKAAAEARRVAGERFAAGVATSTDVLDAQVVLLQAGLDRTQAIAGARLAEARLARALGL